MSMFECFVFLTHVLCIFYIFHFTKYSKLSDRNSRRNLNSMVGGFGCLNQPPPPPIKTLWRRPCIMHTYILVHSGYINSRIGIIRSFQRMHYEKVVQPAANICNYVHHGSALRTCMHYCHAEGRNASIFMFEIELDLS